MQSTALASLPRMVMRGVGERSGALARQSLLVAAVCLAGDVITWLAQEPGGRLGAQEWTLLAAVAVLDVALALPARLAGWVAVAHAALRLAMACVLGGSASTEQGGEAGPLIAGYRAGAWLRGTGSAVAVAALAAGVAGAGLIEGGHAEAPILVLVTKDAVLPWLVGRYTAARRAYLAELERDAENERRAARAALERAIAEERGAVARDLHDVISHYVSAIGVHAGAARMGLGTVPGSHAVAESLTAVETASRSAMADLRRLLSLLNGDSGDADRQPGLGNVEELLDGVRRAGLSVRLQTVGDAFPLSESLEVALYRITQEMLTNALKHGDGSAVAVELHYGASAVSLTARNPVPRPAHCAAVSKDGMHGLAGIRARAALFEGIVSHGPDPTGTWVTSVSFPLPGR